MKVNIEHTGFKMELTYDQDGCLEYVTNIETDKKMMMETYQEGLGYQIKHETFMMSMDVCDARYNRIIDADLFIPRLIFIPNAKQK